MLGVQESVGNDEGKGSCSESTMGGGFWLCILYFSLSGPTHTSAITASAVIQRYTKNCRDRKNEVRFSHQSGSNPSVLFVVSRRVLVSVQLEYDT